MPFNMHLKGALQISTNTSSGVNTTPIKAGNKEQIQSLKDTEVLLNFMNSFVKGITFILCNVPKDIHKVYESYH